MMNIGKFAFGGALLASALMVQPAAATTFLSGKVGSNATYAFGSNGASDPDYVTVAAPGSYAVSSAVGHNVGATGSTPTMSVTSSVDATWASANAGSVNVAWGWLVSNSVSPLSWLVNTYTTVPGGSWSYSFIASADGVFTLDYSYAATSSNSSSFGLTGFVGSGGLGYAQLPSSALTASGTFVVPLEAGKTYNLGLRNSGNSNAQGGAYAVRNATGRFDWKITYNNVAPVPEPASWAMMICGLALVGATMRHRSGLATLAV